MCPNSEEGVRNRAMPISIRFTYLKVCNDITIPSCGRQIASRVPLSSATNEVSLDKHLPHQSWDIIRSTLCSPGCEYAATPQGELGRADGAKLLAD
jgi:hypothetical protein